MVCPLDRGNDTKWGVFLSAKQHRGMRVQNDRSVKEHVGVLASGRAYKLRRIVTSGAIIEHQLGVQFVLVQVITPVHTYRWPSVQINAIISPAKKLFEG